MLGLKLFMLWVFKDKNFREFNTLGFQRPRGLSLEMNFKG
jgi:hypothetical protein